MLNNGPAAISFYRGDWLPDCGLEPRSLQVGLLRITELGTKLIAIFPGTPGNSLTTSEKNSLTFEVLSDSGNRVARQLVIMFQLPEKLRPIYAGFEIRILEATADDSLELPIAAAYAIDKDPTIRMGFADADYAKKLHPEDGIKKSGDMTEAA